MSCVDTVYQRHYQNNTVHNKREKQRLSLVIINALYEQ